MAGKIFCIGLGKTGTSSLEEALRGLGYSVIAFPQTLKDVRRHDAASDTTVSLNFAFLDQAFPGSRFIYTVREERAWLGSCQAMWARRQVFYDANPFMTQVHQALYGSRVYDAGKFSAAYQRYDQSVQKFFATRPPDLLTLDLATEADPWGQLCSFLEKKRPDGAFPQANTSSDIALLTARCAAALGQTAETAKLLHLDFAAFIQLCETGAPLHGDRFAPGWEIDLMLSAAVQKLKHDGQDPCQTLGLNPEWFKAWAQRSGFGAKTKLLPWLQHGLAARFGIALGPTTPFFDGAPPPSNSDDHDG